MRTYGRSPPPPSEIASPVNDRSALCRRREARLWVFREALLLEIEGRDGVPAAGTYTVEAWHEHLGTKQVQVTVAAGKTSELKIDLRVP